MSLEVLLHDRFGFSAFRGVQRDVIERAVAGKHTLAVMPTGAGKSLCYQVPALERRAAHRSTISSPRCPKAMSPQSASEA